jgi:hypothetical protein
VKAYRRSRGIAPFILYLGSGWRWVVNIMPRPLFTQERTLCPLIRRLGGSQSRSGHLGELSQIVMLELRWFSDKQNHPVLQFVRLACYGSYRFRNNLIDISSPDNGVKKLPHKNGRRLWRRTETVALKTAVSGSDLSYSDSGLSSEEQSNNSLCVQNEVT